MSIETKSAETTTSYIELASQGYTLILDAVTAAGKRNLAYFQDIIDISVRPPSASNPENTLREGIERIREIADRSVATLQSHQTANTELAERVVAHTSRIGESVAHGVRGLASLNLNNLAQAKQSTASQFDIITRGVEEAQNRAASQAAQAAQAARTASTVTTGTAAANSNSPVGKN